VQFSSVGKRMVLGYGLVLLMLGVVLASGLYGLWQVVRIYDEALLVTEENARFAQEYAWRVMTASFAVAAFITSADQTYRDQFEAADEAALAILDQLEAQSTSETTSELVGRLRTLQSQYVQGVRPLFITFTGRDAERILRLIGALDFTREELFQTVEELIAHQKVLQAEQRREADWIIFQARWFMVAFAAVAVVIGSIAAIRVTRSVAGPVRAVAQAADRLASGDLRVESLSFQRRDELGDMASSFNRMVQQLRAVMVEIAQASNELMESGRQMAAMTDRSAQSLTQIVDAVNQVAEGAGQQAQHANQTAASAHHLRTAIDQIAAGAQNQARQVQEINVLVQRMSGELAGVAAAARQVAADGEEELRTAQAGNDAVRSAVAGMERLQARVQEVAAKVHELGQHSQRIGEIVALVGDIAEQTNLLALNAAIEAARAGEYGRGFAVVADEVRKLAERSAQSTREIAELVQTIQAGVHDAVAAVETGTQEAEAGSQLARQAGETLERIVTSAEKTSHSAQRIAQAVERVSRDSEEIVRSVSEVASVVEENTAATEEMSAASSQMSEALAEISSVTTETAASAEEVAAAAGEVNGNVERVRDAAGNLTRLAERLNQLVGRFRLPLSE